jgi:hypothetical protein
LTGTAENLSEVVQSFSYKLSVIKKNSTSDNQSTNEQEGFTLNANENKNLSTSQINLTTGDEVIVLLLFTMKINKQLIGKDRVVLGEQKKRTASTTFN